MRSKEVDLAIHRLYNAQNNVWEATLYSKEQQEKDIFTVITYISELETKIEDYETIKKIEVDIENRLNEEEVLISTMKYYIETNQIMTVPEQENQLLAIVSVLNKKNKQINNSVSNDKIRDKIKELEDEKKKYNDSIVLSSEIEVLKSIIGE